jgi:hypothetical protein|tara:strand:+ start:17 stop:454 length:438 start_codon:yes stop_codon:yes gene_type:complete
MRSDYLEKNSGVSDVKKKIRHINAAITLTAEDSGSVFLINQGAAYAITLPECATEDNKLMGWNAEFILDTADSNAVTVQVTDDDGDNMVGLGIDMEGSTGTESTGFDVLTFISGATKGDRASIVCSGDYYYIFSVAADKAHITYG